MFFFSVIHARLITVVRATDSIKENVDVIKSYFSRFQELVAARLIRICRFPLAMVHVCNARELHRYIPTYGCTKIRKRLLRGLRPQLRVVSRFFARARIMWDSTGGALKFKSPMANDKTVYPAQYRKNDATKRSTVRQTCIY